MASPDKAVLFVNRPPVTWDPSSRTRVVSVFEGDDARKRAKKIKKFLAGRNPYDYYWLEFPKNAKPPKSPK